MMNLWKKIRKPLALILAIVIALECTNLLNDATLFAFNEESTEQTEPAARQESSVTV